MSEGPSIGDFSQYVLWAISGILSWLGVRSLNRLDKLERTYVTRDEMTVILRNMNADRDAKHDENRKRLERIEDKLDEDRQKLAEIAAVLRTSGNRARREQ